MNDLISRQAAIDAMEQAKEQYFDRRVIIGKMQNVVSNLPSAQPEQRWIPCSERLPEDWVPVLVTLKKPERLPAWIKAKPENYFHIVDADVCENGEWSVNKKNVIAWMPLPEPYRGGEQNG